MEHRKYPDVGEEKRPLILRRGENGRGGKVKFTLLERLEEGGSVICYTAKMPDTGIGVLKEYYPVGKGLDRDEKDQVVCTSEKKREGFRKEKERFLKPYRMLLKKKQEVDDKGLSTFFPGCTVFYSDTKEEGTVYIWTEERELTTFESACREIRERWLQGPEEAPGKKPSKKAEKETEKRAREDLGWILDATRALTKRVMTLHSLGIIHRDITPGNFGFQRLDKEAPSVDNIRLFDVNTLCELLDEEAGVRIGTPGFMAPERSGDVGPQTDIYSIGATLYSAVILTGNEPETYQGGREGLKTIEATVKSSRLLQAVNSRDVEKKLSAVLGGCLSPRDKRYGSCEELLEALEETRGLLGKRKRAPESGEDLVTRSIQYSLYRHPLYERMPKGLSGNGAENLRVMLVGFGEYGQKFLDVCLPLGQPWEKLEVRVLFDRAGEKESYLAARPSLDQFFNVDNSLGGLTASGVSYGTLRFVEAALERGKEEELRNTLENMIVPKKKGNSPWIPHYVFIALGEDERNLSVAKMLQECREFSEEDYAIGFAWDGGTFEKEKRAGQQGLYPVYMDGESREEPLGRELDRMALNAHLIWAKDLNVDDAVLKKFRDPYYYKSCVGNVLSIQYKLHKMGIELEDGVNAAVSEFRKRLEKNEDKMIWTEHRRWVTEKLCDGWSRKELDDSLEPGGTKDEENKKHICILRSQPNQELTKNAAKWSIEGKLPLDELDTLSVQLHRRLLEKAKKTLEEEDPLFGGTVNSIWNALEGDAWGKAAFQEWYSCMADICSGVRGNQNMTEKTLAEWRKKAALYRKLRGAFLNLDSVRKKEALTAWAKDLDQSFYPVLASIECVDWKQTDKNLVERIPFILTYDSEVCLVTPYAASKDNEECFRNVAAATVLAPRKLLYLYQVERKTDLNALKDTLPRVMNHMARKGLRTKVEVLLIQTKDFENWTAKEQMTKWLEKAGKSRASLWEKEALAVDAILPGKKKNRAECLKTLKNRIRKEGRFLFERRENSELSGLLLADPEFEEASYQFDLREKRFLNCSKGSSMLSHVRTGPCFITVEDMTVFNGFYTEKNDQPEFGTQSLGDKGKPDYVVLWEKYNKDPRVWKCLCNRLEEYCEEEKITFRMAGKQPLTYTRTDLRRRHYEGAKKIFDFLKEKGVITENSALKISGSDRCELKIESLYARQEQLDRIFDPDHRASLQCPEDILLESRWEKNRDSKKREKIVQVGFNRLEVMDCSLENEWGVWEKKMEELLTELKKDGYIAGLKTEIRETELQTNHTYVSFTFNSLPVKKLLTLEGRILEIYVYHKLKDSGIFDDVVSSHEINWGDGQEEIENEYDCIATRGFRSLFIECKATAELKSDFYYKLDTLTRVMGIAPVRVLISDSRETAGAEEDPLSQQSGRAEVNRQIRQRGMAYGAKMGGGEIHTVYLQNEIERIDETLDKIMKKSG